MKRVLITMMALTIASSLYADKGMLRITTEPGDAQIFIDGIRKGSSPAMAGQSFAIKLSEGEHAVVAKIPIDTATEKRAEKSVFLADDTMQSVHLKLGKAMSEDARAKVTAGSQTITFRGLTYKTVTSPYTGMVWLDRNLGAKQACKSFDDEACYGDYYQWGRDADGHEEPESTSFTIAKEGPFDWDSSDDSGKRREAFWRQTDGSGICPAGFRVPTIAELKAETLDQGMKNREDMAASFLVLPAAGGRSNSDGSLFFRGDSGGIWSVSLKEREAQSLDFGSGNARGGSGVRAGGFSVRCFKD